MGQQAAAKGSDYVIPPGMGAPERDDDKGPKTQVNFRSPKGLLEFIDSLKTGSHDRSGVIVFGLGFYRDFYEALGVEWWELTKRAAIEKTQPGALAGRLALEGLKRPQKK